MSLVAGGARGGSHRVEPSTKEESLLITKSLAEMESSRRRSLRKREEKSYVESPDLIFEDETSSSSSNKGKHVKHNVVSNGDVEMESEDEDDDEPLDPLPLPKELPPDAVRERKALIRKLQTQLRNEEMSLVLLKKIRQSQVMADQMANAAAAAAAKAPAVTNNSKDGAYHRATPPPGPGKGAVSSYKSQGSRHHQGHQGSPTPAQIKNLVPDLSQLKPVNVDPKSLPPGLPASLMNMINKGNVKLNNDTAAAAVKATVTKVDTETPAQKQAAAKLALRKQLEKTLLQIPPPKPPPPEMHFIPNPANTEFICLLGLEECVGKILHEDKENTVQPVPFTCSQCGTDFTPTWKWDKGARGKEVKVICEACVTSNVKKALKAEHTNRLKAAFVKALQQEQELEAHMAAQAAQAARGASPDTPSRSGGRGGASVLPASLDVTVRSTSSATVRPIPSAHQSSRTAASSSTPSVTIERAHHRTNASSATAAAATSNSRSSVASITPSRSNNSSSSAANLSRMSSLLNSGGGGNATPPLNNSVSITSTSSSRTAGGNNSSSNSKNDQSSAAAAMAAAARDSANAMAAAALMGAYDPATLALLQQQLLLGAYGSAGSGGGGGSSSNSSGRGGGSGGSSSNNSAAAALTSQLAAMSQQLMNPLLYNYQALAMAQAMQAAGLSGMSSSSSGGGSGSGGGSRGGGGGKSSSSSSSQSATNQMLEIQRQVAAAEQLQRQYLLDMIPPGSLGQSWGKK